MKLTENHCNTFIFLQINAEDIRNIPIKISYHHVKFFIHFITLDRVNLVHLSWMKRGCFYEENFLQRSRSGCERG